jgi:hypothetical protein
VFRPRAGFFDPLGISNDWDQETFDRYQQGEITNGRVAMAVSFLLSK